MKTPLMFITYGYKMALCTWEENGIHRLPLFDNAELASKFISHFEEKMQSLLDDKEKLQVQICDDNKKAVDIFNTIAMIDQSIIITYNPEDIQLNAYDEYNIYEVVEMFD